MADHYQRQQFLEDGDARTRLQLKMASLLATSSPSSCFNRSNLKAAEPCFLLCKIAPCNSLVSVRMWLEGLARSDKNVRASMNPGLASHQDIRHKLSDCRIFVEFREPPYLERSMRYINTNVQFAIPSLVFGPASSFAH
jgi:hypothetical protein